MKFFDAHTHPQFAAYDEDREEVVRRAIDAGVGMVAVGTQKDTSRSALELAEEHAGYVWAAVGLHPIHTSKSYHDPEELGPSFAKASEGKGGFWSRAEEFDYEYYKKLASNPKTVAIGECGLDYFRGKTQEIRDKQHEGFIAQIELAAELTKPLMIHCRAAFRDLIEILNSKSSILNSPPGITHFFTGTKDDAKKLLDMGFYFTFGGVITFPPRRAETSRSEAGACDYDEIIRMVPLDKILSETDAPYVAPVPYRGKPRHQIEHCNAQTFFSANRPDSQSHSFIVGPSKEAGVVENEVLGSVRGKRNEPAYVTEVVKKLAEIKRVPLDKMAEQIFANAKRVFGI
jgi:TatD DNase family protein